MPSFNVNDAGTWRTLKSLNVNDAGTWRALKSLWVNDAGTWRQIFTSADNLSLTAGQASISGPITYTGYNNNSYPWNNGVVGSLTGATLGDGKIVQTITDSVTLNNSILTITGFGADPGIGYLSSLLINGITRTGASAGYSWQPGGNTGMAEWVWSSLTFGMINTNVYPVVLTRG